MEARMGLSDLLPGSAAAFRPKPARVRRAREARSALWTAGHGAR